MIAGADQDQHPLDRGGEVLDLLVAVGVILVGRLVGPPDEISAIDRRHQVDRGVDRLGQDRDRAGDRIRRRASARSGSRSRATESIAAPAGRRITFPPASSTRAQLPRRPAPVADRVLLGGLELRHRPVVARRRCRRARRRGRSRSRRPRAARRSAHPRSGPRRRSPSPSASMYASAQTYATAPVLVARAARRSGARGSPRRSRSRPRTARIARRAGRPAPRALIPESSASAAPPPAALAARALIRALAAKVSPSSGGSSTSGRQRHQLEARRGSRQLPELVLVAGGDDEAHHEGGGQAQAAAWASRSVAIAGSASASRSSRRALETGVRSAVAWTSTRPPSPAITMFASTSARESSE